MSFFATAEDDPQALLKRMAHAITNLNYEGTFVYIHGDQLEALRIYHRVDEKGEHERLVSLNGAAREIVRDGNTLTCILPDTRSVVVEKSRPQRYIPDELLMPRADFTRYYQVKSLTPDRVAGFNAHRIAIEPTDDFRYGYRLWLDQSSYMLLKSQLLDEKRRPIEQFMFTHLEIMQNELSMDMVKPLESGKGFSWFRQENPPEPMPKGKQMWRAGDLPPGFQLSMHTSHRMPRAESKVEHLVYSDGLSSVSVYVERQGDSETHVEGLSSMGGVNAFGTTVRHDDQHYQVVAMGEVPAATVERIARSVRYNR